MGDLEKGERLSSSSNPDKDLEVLIQLESSGPFEFKPSELSELFDPKSLELLKKLGGLQAILDGLNTTADKGLCNVHDDLFTGVGKSLSPTTTTKTSSAKTQTHHKEGKPAPPISNRTPSNLSLSSSSVAPPGKRPLRTLRSQSSFALGNITAPDSSTMLTAGVIEMEQNAMVNGPEHAVADNVLFSGDMELHKARLDVYGANVLPPVKSKSILELMWLALNDKILILLTVAALASLAVGLYEDFRPQVSSNPEDNQKIHWIEGFSIIMAVLIVVLAGSINDYQKEKQFQKLNARKEDRLVKVIRNGSTQQISIYHVLVGDVLELQPGDVIAADGVLIGGMNLKCDESAATGESDAIKKGHDRDPFLLSGSKVTEGVGKYVVVAVGVHSFNGKTMLALRQPAQSTPLQVKLDKIAENIAKIGASIAIVLFLALILKYVISVLNTTGFGNDPVQESGAEVVARLTNILIAAITLVVVAVPEGLPLAVTVALAYATTRMLRDNNLVRVLAACETMGCATTVCSDKTGTLTQNKMKVVHGTIGKYIHFEGEDDLKEIPKRLCNIKGDAGERKAGDAPNGEALLDLLIEGNALNSSAFEEVDKNTGEIEIIGSKTEVALLGWLGAMGYTFSDRRVQPGTSVVQVYPFSSERKSMSTLIKKTLPNGQVIYRMHVKGASEIVLSYCNKVVALPPDRQLRDHRRHLPEKPMIQSLNSRGLKELNDIIHNYAEQSLRTICLAYREWPEEEINSWLRGPIRDQVIAAKKAELQEEKKRKYSAMGEIILDRNLTQHEIHRTDTLNTTTSSTDGVSPLSSGFPEEMNDSEILAHPLALIQLASQELACAAIVGIEDPLRPGVASAVQACQRAGVVVRMVTGDNVLTARAIAAKCGILTRNGKVMEGAAFRKLSEPEMDAIIPSLCVLARSSPTDKQTLVSRLKNMGEVVAVTGDGTNDGPALKMADVGFSMGIAGTEVAKEASSIILMDDNFESIVKAIMWGRAVNDSVKKFLQFQLTVNITAVVLAVVSSLADSTESSALTAVQLLWVNLIMDTLAALALATERPTQTILERPPEGRSSPLVNTNMWKMILGQAIFQIVIGLTLLFSGAQLFGLSALAASGGILGTNDDSSTDAINEKTILRTIFFNTFVLLQLFNQINARRIDKSINVFENIFSNPYFYCIWTGIAIVQVIIVQFGTFVFNVSALNGAYWGVCIFLGILSLPVGVLLRLLPDEVLPWIWWKDNSHHSFSPEAARPISIGGVTSTSINSEFGGTRILPGRATGSFALSGDPECSRALARENWQQTLDKVPELKVFTTLRGSGRIFSERVPAIRDGRPPSISSSTSYIESPQRRRSYPLSKHASTKPVRGGSTAALAGIGIELAGTGFRPGGSSVGPAKLGGNQRASSASRLLEGPLSSSPSTSSTSITGMQKRFTSIKENKINTSPTTAVKDETADSNVGSGDVKGIGFKQ